LPRADACLWLLLQWLYGLLLLLWMLFVILFGGDDDGEGCELRAEALSALGAELKCWRGGGQDAERKQSDLQDI
jgi:hypothetical protein